ncbi:hypothetical protein CRE_23893 [Caenorhabditis remanei]|uniref:Uncharacterized protein n=1 Tax=Caenorhabditis remanei TaxID=31234 RepID=E3MGA7_CAERE|nr:hypothetical protein CRE_23893 [Caenorhabditis remanei]
MDSAQIILHKTIIEVSLYSNMKVDVYFQTMQKQTDFKCGDFAGPFTLINGEKSLNITVGFPKLSENLYNFLQISNFTGEKMSLEIEDTEITRRIQSVSTPLLANCVLLQTGKLIQILFTKDIMISEPLRAVLVADMNHRQEQQKQETDKKYECSKCHMAKFNSLQNLKVHEEMYCTKKEVQVPENKKSCFENPQNLILLPMAYHDLLQQNAVQVMGPVHSLIPVAVGRKSTLVNTSPIFVHNKTNLEIPTNLNISNSKLSINIPVIDLDEKIPSTSTVLDLSSSSQAASIPSLSPSCSPTSKSSSSEPFYPDRPFSCTCGVSFSSQTTYDAHRQLYCSHTVGETSSGGPNRNDSSRKVTSILPFTHFISTFDLSESFSDYNLELWP